MTPEPPPPSSPRPRPDPDGPTADRRPPAEPPRRESLAESLSRIPDLRPGDLDEVVEPAPSPVRTPRVDGVPPVRPAVARPPAAPRSRPAAPETARPSRPRGSEDAVPGEAGTRSPATPASVPVVSAVVAAPTAAAPVAPTAAAPVGADDEALARPTVEAGAEVAPAAMRRLRRPSAAIDPDVLSSPAAFTAPVPAGHGPAPWWRRTALALTIVVLAAAIPALSYVGYDIIGDSTAGQYTDSNASPSDPGYEAQVVPTPTAVAVQYGPDGQPTAATFLALSGGDGGPAGGAVVFVPLDTEPVVTNFGVNTLRLAYSSIDADPMAAQVQMVGQIGRLMNVGIEETIRLDDDLWTQIITPVGPLQIDYGDAIDLGNGTVIPAGPTELQADEVGPYLAASPEGTSDLSRLDRQEMVWRAWMRAVAGSPNPDAVPGESTSGMGRFARQLAKGGVTYETMPVDGVAKTARFRVDKAAVAELVTDTIPSPNPGAVGQRFTVRLLNGVAAEAIPAEVARSIVKLGGSATIIGNGPRFDTDETTITYRDPGRAQLAELLLVALGGKGEVVLDPKAPDTIDITIVLGRDLLGDDPVAGSPGSTTPSTTGGS